MATLTKKQSKRGRPARLSRQQILEAALALLEQGADKVTISGVARALDVAPMSLYSHVLNRDDLLLGVSDLVLGQLDMEPEPDLPWQEAVRRWLFEVHNHLASYPQVVNLIGAAQSLPPQWLRVHGKLVELLQGAGLQGETLVHSARWLAQMLITDILLNTPGHPLAGETAVLDAIERLPEEDRHNLALLLPHLHHSEQTPFQFAVEQALARLDQLAASDQ